MALVAEQQIVAGAAAHDVVVGAAAQLVVELPAIEVVLAGAAVEDVDGGDWRQHVAAVADQRVVGAGIVGGVAGQDQIGGGEGGIVAELDHHLRPGSAAGVDLDPRDAADTGDADLSRRAEGRTADEGEALAAGIDAAEIDAVVSRREVLDAVGGGRQAVAQLGEHEQIPAGAADQAVAAGTAREHVGAGAAVDQVVAARAEQSVVAGLAEQLVVVVAALQPVGARATVDEVVAEAATQNIGAGEAVQDVVAETTEEVVAAAGAGHVIGFIASFEERSIAQHYHWFYLSPDGVLELCKYRRK